MRVLGWFLRGSSGSGAVPGRSGEVLELAGWGGCAAVRLSVVPGGSGEGFGSGSQGGLGSSQSTRHILIGGHWLIWSFLEP